MVSKKLRFQRSSSFISYLNESLCPTSMTAVYNYWIQTVCYRSHSLFQPFIMLIKLVNSLIKLTLEDSCFYLYFYLNVLILANVQIRNGPKTSPWKSLNPFSIMSLMTNFPFLAEYTHIYSTEKVTEHHTGHLYWKSWIVITVNVNNQDMETWHCYGKHCRCPSICVCAEELFTATMLPLRTCSVFTAYMLTSIFRK